MINSNPNHIYLSGVRIEDFRSLGKSDVSLHPGPGVVLLVGPNGLGKSSWFEAIEMALVGEIRRWQEPPIDNIPRTAQVRKGALHEMWSIELRFQDQKNGQSKVVSRNGPSPLDGTSVDDVISNILALRPEAWSLNRSNLSSFLYATHILAQSTRLRFFSKERRKRWDDVLRQVSGFARMLQACDNVGQGTKRAFTELVYERQNQLSAAEEALGVWQHELELLDAAESRRASRLETIDPEKARIALKTEHITIPLPPALSSAKDDAIAMISELRGMRDILLTSQSEITARIKGYEALRELPVEVAQVLTLQSEARHQVDAVQAGLDVAETTIARVQAERDELSHALDEARTQADRARNVVEAINLFRTIESGFNVATEAERKAEATLAGAITSASQVEALLKAAEESRQRRFEWETRRDSLQRRRVEIDEANRRLERIAQLFREQNAVEQNLREKTALHEILQSERADIAAEVVALEAKVRISETALRESLVRNDAIKNAIATIAAYLPTDAVSCPVCSQEWKPAGTLSTKAKAAATAFEPNLTSIENELNQAKAEFERLHLTADQIDGKIVESNALLKRLTIDVSTYSTEIQRLRDFPIFLDHDQTTLETHVQEMAAQLSAEEPALAAASGNQLPSVSDQNTEIIKIREQLRVARIHLADATRNRDQAREAKSAAKAQASALMDHIHRLDVSVQGTEDDRARYEQTRVNSDQDVLYKSNQLRDSEHRLAAANTDVNAGRQELVNKRRQLAELDARNVALKARWMQLGLEEPVTSESLERALAVLLTQRQQIEQQREVVERVASALSHWLEDEETNKIRERLIAQAQSNTVVAFTAHKKVLEDEVKRRRMLLDRIKRVREKVDTLSSRLGGDANMLRKRIGEALKEPLGRLLPALVLDPVFHKLHLEIGGSSQRTEVGVPLGDDQAEHYLSEGQMAGVSLAVLLAMATTFRWSRWPALILDDPTQHNDLIHATNLIEVLRTLVLTEGFQVFMSTHDREFAEFVQKKFKNAMIPGTLLRFRDPMNGQGVIPILSSWGETLGV